LVTNLTLEKTITLEDQVKRFGMKQCPMDLSLNTLGKKYACHVLRNMLLLKHNKFKQFLNNIEGINSKTLSIRLRELASDGIIEKKIIQNSSNEIEYYPTRKGKAVEPILVAMANFSATFDAEKIWKDEKPKTIQKAFDSKGMSDVWD